MLFKFFFFFSSRRRHTRCSRDWSSDVCSSDLFGMVDVAGNDGAAARDLAADELGGDEGRHFGAKTFAVGEGCLGTRELLFAAEILALGDIDHLLGDDAGAGKFKLRDLVAVEAAQRLVMRNEGLRGMRGADIAIVFRLDVTALIFL